MTQVQRIGLLIVQLWDRMRGATISRSYTQLNEKLHAEKKTYGTSSAKWLNVMRALIKQTNAASALDYGCGKALLSEGLAQEISFQNFDPAIPKYSARPKPADIVACTDVLEHVEPHLLKAVLKDLESLSQKTLFAVISTRPAAKFLADGRNAHLIQEPANWWEEKLKSHFSSVVQIGESKSAGEIIFVCYLTGTPNNADLEELRGLVEAAHMVNNQPKH